VFFLALCIRHLMAWEDASIDIFPEWETPFYPNFGFKNRRSPLHRSKTFCRHVESKGAITQVGLLYTRVPYTPGSLIHEGSLTQGSLIHKGPFSQGSLIHEGLLCMRVLIHKGVLYTIHEGLLYTRVSYTQGSHIHKGLICTRILYTQGSCIHKAK